ncbi:MAG: hypothetical protein AB9846_09565 [Tenuifilaceae bacterium]
MRVSIFSFCILIVYFIAPSCNSWRSKKIVDEGIIEYTISHDDSLKPNFNKNLLPSHFTVKFKGKNTLNKIEGLSGAVSLTFINNHDTQSRLVLIKLLNKKLFYQEPLTVQDTLNAFAGMPDIIIDSKVEKINYSGYKCTKVNAFFKDSTNIPFFIIYTNETKVLNPNLNTPFEKIDGIMFKFKVKLFNHLMTFTATNIKAAKVSIDEFNIPEGFEKVDRKTIEDVISLIQ